MNAAALQPTFKRQAQDADDLAIDVQGINKSFRGQSVLKNLTMQVKRGSTYAFLGRNGAGKTTTIQILLGLLKRDEGRIRVMGYDPARQPIELRTRVGYLAEDQQMYGWMRVDEILCFMAPFYPTWDHDLAQKYLGEFELPGKTKIKHLSKGQSVRLGLVLALAHRPELVILDDPALGLDPIMRGAFNRDLITHLQGEGRTVFYSSHLLYEVEPVADEVAILYEGHLVIQSDTESLRQQVKRFILPRAAWEKLQPELKQLDLRMPDSVNGDDQVSVAVENAPQVQALLQREQVEHRTIDLNLDEIFEAYVAGKRADNRQ